MGDIWKEQSFILSQLSNILGYDLKNGHKEKSKPFSPHNTFYLSVQYSRWRSLFSVNTFICCSITVRDGSILNTLDGIPYKHKGCGGLKQRTFCWYAWGWLHRNLSSSWTVPLCIQNVWCTYIYILPNKACFIQCVL